MKRIIKKNKHSEWPPIWGFHFGKQSMSFKVRFTESCRYNLGDIDQDDWNKLFGFSYGLHHNNSIRVGWRYKDDFDLIELCIYQYIDGKRVISETRKTILLNREYELELNNFGLIIADRRTKMLEAIVCKSTKPKWGYDLGLYFGGNNPAPHDMVVYMERL